MKERQDGERLLDATALACAEATRDNNQHGELLIRAAVKAGKIQWIEANFVRRQYVDGQGARV